MAAFNWLHFEHYCPVCAKFSPMRADIHVCASFDGDQDGSFDGRTYALGQRMAWLASNHPRYSSWCSPSELRVGDSGAAFAEEDCYTNCQTCSAPLFARVQVADFTPTLVSVEVDYEYVPDRPIVDLSLELIRVLITQETQKLADRELRCWLNSRMIDPIRVPKLWPFDQFVRAVPVWLVATDAEREESIGHCASVVGGPWRVFTKSQTRIGLDTTWHAELADAAIALGWPGRLPEHKISDSRRP